MDIVPIIVVPLVFGGILVFACCCGCKDDSDDDPS
jgi:hypothetical protein